MRSSLARSSSAKVRRVACCPQALPSPLTRDSLARLPVYDSDRVTADDSVRRRFHADSLTACAFADLILMERLGNSSGASRSTSQTSSSAVINCRRTSRSTDTSSTSARTRSCLHADRSVARSDTGVSPGESASTRCGSSRRRPRSRTRSTRIMQQTARASLSSQRRRRPTSSGADTTPSSRSSTHLRRCERVQLAAGSGSSATTPSNGSLTSLNGNRSDCNAGRKTSAGSPASAASNWRSSSSRRVRTEGVRRLFWHATGFAALQLIPRLVAQPASCSSTLSSARVSTSLSHSPGSP
jgi:hypothetical protein